MRIKDILPYSLTVIYPQPLYARNDKQYENIAIQTIGNLGKDFELRYRYGGIYGYWQYEMRENPKFKYNMEEHNTINRIRFYFKSKEDRNLFKLAAIDIDPEVKIIDKNS